ncbi:MAG: oligosaccharide flippase family protein [Elusimicrobia bacterium]|nr:oligosaccharide flippase family protein [Elusimicrobiota bacterium]
MRLNRDLLWSLLGYGLTFPLALGSSALAARALGPAGRGALSAILALPMLLPYLAALGAVQSTIYFIARRPHDVGRYLGTAVALGVAASLAICLGAWPVQAYILRSFDESVRHAGLMFLLFVPVNIIFALPSSAFQGLQSFAAFNVLRVMPQVLYLAVLVAAWQLGVGEAGWIARAYLAVCVVLAIPIAWLTYAAIVRRRVSADMGTVRETASYGLYSMLSNLPTTANRNIDQLFIAAMLPAADLGWYAVSASWGSLLAPVMYAIGSNLFPRLAGAAADDARRHFAVVLKWSLLLIAGATIFLLALTPIVIPLVFGQAFAPAVRPARVLVLAGAFLAVNIVLEDGLRGLGRLKVLMVAQLAALAVTLIGLPPALRHGGIMGAAWLSLVSYATASIILVGALSLRRADPEKIVAK